MKIDAQLVDIPLQDMEAEAERYERMGFDGLWSRENKHDPYLPLTLAARVTSRISLGTNVAIALARSPFSTAQIAWDLQDLSGGRMNLGLGTQVRAHIERRFSMPFEHPAARIREYVDCVRAVWDSFQNNSQPNYEGEFYRFKLNAPAFISGPLDNPHIPIHLAGVNPTMVRTAGEVADGFHVHPFHSVEYLREVVLANLDEGARKRGRSAADIELSGPIFTVTADTQAAQDTELEAIRSKAAFYGSTPNYRRVLAFHGLEELGKELSVLARRGEWDAMSSKLPDSMLERMVIVAKPGEVAAKIRERYAGILHRVSLYHAIPRDQPDGTWQAMTAAFHAA
jgi:probable F420-dependent oxidoreductase